MSRRKEQAERTVGAPFEIPDGYKQGRITVLHSPSGELLRWTHAHPDRKGLIEALQDAFKEHRGGSTPTPPPKVTSKDLMCVYPIADQHNGLLAWAGDTGESYDLKRGARRLRDTSARLFDLSPPARQALILNLGDWQHTDDGRNETPGHRNPLDVDSRYPKILRMGVDLMKEIIERAKEKHERVIVKNMAGNHDPHASVALTVGLSEFYANDNRVQVDTDWAEHWYFRFGQTLLGAHHGHRCKPQNLVQLMSDARREDWGSTRWHWILTGHIHHETAKEIGSCRVESFQTLASKDAYHAAKGYTAGQSLSAIVIHREDGEIGRHRVNIPPPRYSAASFKEAA